MHIDEYRHSGILRPMARGRARLEDPSPGGPSSIYLEWTIADIMIIGHAEKVSPDPTEEVEKSIGLRPIICDIPHVISPVTLSQRSRTLATS